MNDCIGCKYEHLKLDESPCDQCMRNPESFIDFYAPCKNIVPSCDDAELYLDEEGNYAYRQYIPDEYEY